MSYTTASGRHADTLEVFLASGNFVGSGNGSAVELGDRGTLRLQLDVTDASGETPTLDVEVQTSFDGTNWRALGSFAQRTTEASERKSFSGADRFVRVSYTLGGTDPAFSFSVQGEAV